jgi:hypothetical protein
MTSGAPRPARSARPPAQSHTPAGAPPPRETHERLCPACHSEAIAPVGHIIAADGLIKVREGRAAAGMPDLPRADRIRYEEAAADLRLHYQTTGTRNMVEAEKRLRHLDPFLTGRKLASIGGADATAYVAHRQAEGVANGTTCQRTSRCTSPPRSSACGTSSASSAA